MIKFLSVPALMALLLQLRWVHQVSHRAAASLTLITSGRRHHFVHFHYFRHRHHVAFFITAAGRS
jgi:hypothetical protein